MLAAAKVAEDSSGSNTLCMYSWSGFLLGELLSNAGIIAIEILTAQAEPRECRAIQIRTLPWR